MRKKGKPPAGISDVAAIPPKQGLPASSLKGPWARRQRPGPALTYPPGLRSSPETPGALPHLQREGGRRMTPHFLLLVKPCSAVIPPTLPHTHTHFLTLWPQASLLIPFYGPGSKHHF